VIIFGPPARVARTNTPPLCNVVEFSLSPIACIGCVPFRRKDDQNLFALPPAPVASVSSAFFSLLVLSCVCIRVRMYACVWFVCICVYMLHASHASLSSESSTARQCAAALPHVSRSFLFFFDGCSVRRERALPARLLRATDCPPLYMPLMSILRLAVFLSL